MGDGQNCVSTYWKMPENWPGKNASKSVRIATFNIMLYTVISAGIICLLSSLEGVGTFRVMKLTSRGWHSLRRRVGVVLVNFALMVF